MNFKSKTKLHNDNKFYEPSTDDNFLKKKIRFENVACENNRNKVRRHRDKKIKLDIRKSSSLDNLTYSADEIKEFENCHNLSFQIDRDPQIIEFQSTNQNDNLINVPVNLDQEQSFNNNSKSSSNSEFNIFNEQNDQTEFSQADDVDENMTSFSELLYENSRITLTEFLISIYSLKVKHNLCDNVINDLLSIIKLSLPLENTCPKTMFKFENTILKDQKIDFYKHCKKCSYVSDPLALSNFKDVKTICVNCESPYADFACLDLKCQIVTILEDQKKFKQILKTKEECKKGTSIIESAIDGTIYNSFKKNFTEKEVMLSLNLNTDGCPLTNSRDFCVWPILGTILELEQKTREKFENVLLLGLWLNLEKPSYNIFFEKSIEKLIDLIKNPIYFKGYKIFIRCQSLIVDLPARAEALNTMQFNGYFGCSQCFHPGEYIRKYRLMTYPPLESKTKTFQDYSYLGNLSKLNGETLFGIRGISPFSKVMTIPDQVPFDYLHLVLQGHAKWLLRQYIDEKDSEYFLGNKLNEINHSLINIKYPHNFSRKFNRVDTKLKLKSAELKLFIFYVSVPVLFNFLPNKYWNLLCLYVFSIRTFYEPIYDRSRLERAKEMINIYHKVLDSYFSDKSYLYTIHAHLHLYDQGALGNMKKFVAGTSGYIGQMCRKMLFLKNLSSIFDEKKYNNRELYEKTEKILKRTAFSNDQLIDAKRKEIDESEMLLFNQSLDFQFIEKKVLTADRLFFQNRVFHSFFYKKKENSNSYTICFIESEEELYGEILNFYEIERKFFARVKTFVLKKNLETVESKFSNEFSDFLNINDFNFFYKIIEESQHIKLIDCSKILFKCLRINNFITKLSYDYEHD
ncbi:unnamed protein product [Brachionus calyciflorus]|uniref:Uncharacterized protein n=1 Tax=Brachionus calyciflorus TaxID=104777 RepID=A0A813Y5J1_9BILA|nr:unnamed protein product [Brachionus calyciflorus]